MQISPLKSHESVKKSLQASAGPFWEVGKFPWETSSWPKAEIQPHRHFLVPGYGKWEKENAKAPPQLWSHEHGRLNLANQHGVGSLSSSQHPSMRTTVCHVCKSSSSGTTNGRFQMGAAEYSLKHQLLAKQTGIWFSWCHGQMGHDFH